MKYVNASVVAIMMPFSAVVTGVGSVLVGFDTLSVSLVVGGAIVLMAIVMSGLDDLRGKKKF